MSVHVICSSPSCAARIELNVTRQLDAALRQAGWTIERQAYDLKALPYCPRCREEER